MPPGFDQTTVTVTARSLTDLTSWPEPFLLIAATVLSLVFPTRRQIISNRMFRLISLPPRGRATSLLVALLLVISTSAAMARHLVLESAKDVKEASADADEIWISTLPIEAYPLLAKFTKIRRIDFYDRNGTGADDKRLRALALLNFPALKDVSLLNCPAVTDDGITALSRFTSLKEFQLEGTSITDEGVQVLAGRISGAGVNVANCGGVTFKGLLMLASSSTAKGIGFSTENVNQAQVLEIINRLKPNMEECQIVDQKKKLDRAVVKQAAKARGVKFFGLARKGALQEMNEVP